MVVWLLPGIALTLEGSDDLNKLGGILHCLNGDGKPGLAISLFQLLAMPASDLGLQFAKFGDYIAKFTQQLRPEMGVPS